VRRIADQHGPQSREPFEEIGRKLFLFSRNGLDCRNVPILGRNIEGFLQLTIRLEIFLRRFQKHECIHNNWEENVKDSIGCFGWIDRRLNCRDAKSVVLRWNLYLNFTMHQRW
jgi:hypothetical protein